MNQWDALIRAATLGTLRDPTATDDLTDALLGQLPDRRPEHVVLSAAGLWHLAEQAGRLPTRLTAPVDAPDADAWPPLALSGTRLLALLLGGRYPSLLPEFLAAMAQHQQRIPDAYLPNALTLGVKNSVLRPAILAVIGARGRWLATQNPNWAYAAPAAVTWEGALALWHALPVGKRQGLVRQLRQTQPALGRQLLETVWKEAPEAVRGGAARTLEEGLSAEDEPFLERLLDDRAPLVRRKAADMLAALPTSRLSARMTARVSTGPLARLLQWRKGVRVAFPLAWPAELARDGVVLESKKKLASLRSEQLRHIVGAVPLSHWTEKWGVSAETIIDSLPDSGWPRTLTAAFSLAALRQQDVGWALALLHHAGLTPSTLTVLPLLDLAEVEELLTSALAQLPADAALDKAHPVPQILLKYAQPWSEALALKCLDFVEQALPQPDAAKPALPVPRLLLRQYARFAPPALADHTADRLASCADQTPLQAPVADTIRVVRFRQKMLNALIPNP